MLKKWRDGVMRTLFATGIVLILQQSAYSLERIDCGGTEPFWVAKLSDTQVIFALSGGGRRMIYPKPRYTPAAGASIDFVRSVRATRGKSTVLAFIVNEALMKVADKRGNAPSDPDSYRAYCSDGMSDRGYPLSIYLIVDDNVYTGCCSTAAAPPVGSD
jgi:uncharacterized membrane protein